MELNGERIIPAPVDATWAALNDPSVLKACIAGCESLERTADDAYAAVVAVRVGPVSARFRGSLKMTNIEAPHRYTINFEGQGGVAGFGKGSADVALAEAERAQTRLTYAAKAQVGGKLAQVGSRLIDAAAGKITDDFFKAFEAHVSAARADEAPARAGAAVAVGPDSGLGPGVGVAPLGRTAVPRPRQPVGALGWGLAAAVVIVLIYFLTR